MPSSFSTDLKLELMVTGENAGTWGTKTNTNLNLLQQAIAGYQDISIAGGAQTTALTMDNATISNARNAVIKLTGTITGNQIVTVPNGIEKTYIVSNGTTGAFTVEFKTASGTGPTFSTTDKGIKILFTDGTNVIDVNANFSASSFPQINDSNGNEEIKFTTTASAVNEFTIAKAATGNGPEISATGRDTNIELKITPKGTGKINLDGIKFPNADGSAGQALVTNGSGVLSFASAGLAWQSVQTTGFTAVKGNAYPCNTTSAGFTVTLPATPSAGDQVQVVDYAGTFDTNALLISPNGNKLEGDVSILTLSGEREGVILTYIDSTQGWIATSGINEGTDALGFISVDTLVVAGGGGGGATGTGGGAGGAGAGGFRLSTSTILTATDYTITVGAGGAGSPGTGGGSPGTVGSNSVAFTTFTSNGGGGGGGGSSAGGNGGSGGGGRTGSTAGSGNTPATSPSQGNNGGAGGPFSDNFTGGGGGGASAVGVAGASTVGGNGGAGTASSITGSSVTRAGGGGGGTYLATGTAGSGGTGGGGAGGNGASNPPPGIAGTVNTGGGGGGAGLFAPSTVGVGGTGGSGIVILKYPDSLTITNPGGGLTSSTPAAAGGFKVTSFTAGTGTIQFN